MAKYCELVKLLLVSKSQDVISHERVVELVMVVALRVISLFYQVAVAILRNLLLAELNDCLLTLLF